MSGAFFASLRRAGSCTASIYVGFVAAILSPSAALAAPAALRPVDHGPIAILTAANAVEGHVGSVVADNTDSDDGNAVVSGRVITFGRALDLQGTPLVLRAHLVQVSGKGLFPSGLYTGPFVRPAGLPVRASNVSSGFGTRWHPLLGGYRFHAGIDLVAPAGTQILATSPGVVTEAGWCGGYGLCVTIDHGDGYHTLYGHLSGLEVSAGQRVQSGQRLGQVGSTGQSTGPHLHYEVRINGRPIDPRPYLK